MSFNAEFTCGSLDMLYDTSPKQAVKLPGLHSKITFEEILESLSKYISPSSIKCVLKDPFTHLFVVFIADLQSFCVLISNKFYIGDSLIRPLPLYDCCIIEGVFPQITDDEIRKIFKVYGHVYSIVQLPALPNSPKFSHVLSGRREISFLLPSEQTEIAVPSSLYIPPYKFKIVKYCFACSSEGHSVIQCPDIDDDYAVMKPALNLEIKSVISIKDAASSIDEKEEYLNDM
ncbi:hypothetical protein X975_18209, partial [Stegodyphus mimosarum]